MTALPPPQLSYGFIGLGSMGYPMCVNLREKIPTSSKLYIYDVVGSVLDRFKNDEQGRGEISVVKSPKEIADSADVIITMLPKSHHVQQVFYSGERSLLEMDRSLAVENQPKLFIDCSTIDAAVTREIGKKVEASKIGNFADAAVSGGPLGARQATLTFMIGCDPEIANKVKSIVGMMGTSLFHCGPVGAGVGVKLINNYLSGCSILAASEALNIGAKMGLDLKTLTDILNVSSGQCWVTSKNNPVPGVQPNAPSSKGYKGGFAIELATSVIELAVQTAESVNAKLTLAPSLLKAFHSACEDERCRGLDARVIYRWVSDTNAGAIDES